MEQEVSSDEGIYILPLEILYPSSEQIEARRKEMEQADKEREEEWEKLEEEMAALDKKNEELCQERIKKEQEAAQNLYIALIFFPCRKSKKNKKQPKKPKKNMKFRLKNRAKPTVVEAQMQPSITVLKTKYLTKFYLVFNICAW